jgi:hypothetical protein
MAKHWAIKDRDNKKFRERSKRPEIKTARSAAKNEKVKQGVKDQQEATAENIDYGHGVEVNSPLRKKAKTGTGKCKCGSDTHKRTTSKACPLNPAKKKETLPSSGIHLSTRSDVSMVTGAENIPSLQEGHRQVTKLQAAGKGP